MRHPPTSKYLLLVCSKCVHYWCLPISFCTSRRLMQECNRAPVSWIIGLIFHTPVKWKFLQYLGTGYEDELILNLRNVEQEHAIKTKRQNLLQWPLGIRGGFVQDLPQIWFLRQWNPQRRLARKLEVPSRHVRGVLWGVGEAMCNLLMPQAACQGLPKGISVFLPN